MGLVVPLAAVMETKLGLILGSALPVVMLLFLRHNAKNEKKQKAVAGLTSDRSALTWKDPSTRFSSLSSPSDSPYGAGWKEFGANPYDASTNPDGCINLAMAENRLSLDILQSWLNFNPEATSLAGKDAPATLEEIAGYNDYHGTPELRKELAGLMDTVLGAQVSFDPDNLVVTSGASAAVELLAFCIGDPGDAFIVPAPYYPGFDRDVEWRSQVKIVPAHTDSRSDFLVTQDCLEEAWAMAQSEGLNVRAVLLSSPSNPVGLTYDTDTLLTILEFAREKALHVVCDEIYAGSVFDEPRFASIVEVMSREHEDQERVHVVYGLAKDLSLPGLRVGVLCSWNRKILLAAQKLARITSVSTQTQAFLVCLLKDRSFIEGYLKDNQRRLREARRKVVEAVESAGLHAAKGNAGQYVWLDLSSLLPTEDFAGEVMLFRRLVYEAGLNLNAGHDCHSAEPGWFRLCFAVADAATLDVALTRLQQFAKKHNKLL